MTTHPSLFTISLPYFRDPQQLPRPLPTSAEIQAAKIIPTKRENYGGDFGRVATIESYFIIKFGRYIKENEGVALLFLEKHCPSVPAPRLYAMYRENDILYLVMELLPGQNLRDVWDRLLESEKITICNQLKISLAKVRSIPSAGLFSSVARESVPHRFFDWMERDSQIVGPFKSSLDFHRGMALHLRKQYELNDRRPLSSEWFERHFAQTPACQRSIFTHCDLIRQNIIVQEYTDNDGQKQVKLSGIVDWELSGWYPEYWEYAAYFVDALWEGDWEDRFESIIDPYPLESAMLRLYKLDLEGY